MDKASTDELDYLANHPRIKPATGVDEDKVIRMAAFYNRPRNVAFKCPIGCMLFAYEGDDVFIGHFMFIPGHHGKLIKGYAQGMLDEMFTSQGAHVIRGYIPRENRAARVMASALGFTQISQDTVDAMGRPCVTYEMSKELWGTLLVGSSVASPGK